MAEEPEPVPIENEEPEETPGYKAPAQKSIDEIKNLDADDESLVKYKETLLAGVDPAAGIDRNIIDYILTSVFTQNPVAMVCLIYYCYFIFYSSC